MKLVLDGGRVGRDIEGARACWGACGIGAVGWGGTNCVVCEGGRTGCTGGGRTGCEGEVEIEVATDGTGAGVLC